MQHTRRVSQSKRCLDWDRCINVFPFFVPPLLPEGMFYEHIGTCTSFGYLTFGKVTGRIIHIDSGVWFEISMRRERLYRPCYPEQPSDSTFSEDSDYGQVVGCSEICYCYSLRSKLSANGIEQ